MSRAYTSRFVAPILFLSLLAVVPVFAHDTDHHATTSEILTTVEEVLEEVQALRDELDDVYDPVGEGAGPGVGVGGDVTDCIKIRWGVYDEDDLYYRNTCSYTVSVAYCDLNPQFSWQESCGDNRNAVQPYFTGVKYLCPGDENKWDNPGEMNWATCEGYLSSVRDSSGGFTSDHDGDYTCPSTPSSYDPCQ